MMQTAVDQRRERIGRLELVPPTPELEQDHGGAGGDPDPPAPPDELERGHYWHRDDRRREALLMLAFALVFTLAANALLVGAAARFAQE